MTSVTNQQSDSTVLSGYTYGYDDAGQRTWVKRSSGYGDVFKYDASEQLTNVLYEAADPDTSPSAWTNEARYVFDAAGNRTSVELTNTGTTSYTANALNQYTAVGGTTPTYDDNGNLTYDGSVWTHRYDRENRLTEADSLSATVHYFYDAFNRLVWRTQAASETRFYYDDQWRVIAEYDENDSLVAKYVYGPEIDEPLQMTRDGTDYYYHAAALGTVTEITLSDETIVERYTYDVYGEPQMWDGSGNPISSSGIGNRLMFQGRDRDPHTGVYNFRNRYYSPGLGRFVQVDPIREEGGLNLYVFVSNNPVNRADPLGLVGPVDPYPEWPRPPTPPTPPKKIRDPGCVQGCWDTYAEDVRKISRRYGACLIVGGAGCMEAPPPARTACFLTVLTVCGSYSIAAHTAAASRLAGCVSGCPCIEVK